MSRLAEQSSTESANTRFFVQPAAPSIEPPLTNDPTFLGLFEAEAQNGPAPLTSPQESPGFPESPDDTGASEAVPMPDGECSPAEPDGEDGPNPYFAPLYGDGTEGAEEQKPWDFLNPIGPREDVWTQTVKALHVDPKKRVVDAARRQEDAVILFGRHQKDGRLRVEVPDDFDEYPLINPPIWEEAIAECWRIREGDAPKELASAILPDLADRPTDRSAAGVVAPGLSPLALDGQVSSGRPAP